MKIRLQRDDIHVRLPCVEAEFLVVDSLRLVAASILIGVDTIAQLGGVQMSYSDGDLSGVLFGSSLEPDAHSGDVNAALAPESVSKLFRLMTMKTEGDNILLEWMMLRLSTSATNELGSLPGSGRREWSLVARLDRALVNIDDL